MGRLRSRCPRGNVNEFQHNSKCIIVDAVLTKTANCRRSTGQTSKYGQDVIDSASLRFAGRLLRFASPLLFGER
jgi:hypothetical protein